MYCEACGKQILDDSKFCEFCGAPVKTISKPIEKKEALTFEELNNKRLNDQSYKKAVKPKSKIKLIPLMLIVLMALAGYFAVSIFGMDNVLNEISNLPNLILGKENSSREPTREDFSWYVPMSYDEVPQDGSALIYEDILGEWKLMVVNYQSIPEETYFSSVVLKTNPTDNNTVVELTHYYVEFDGEKYPFEGDEVEDLLYGYYADGYLTLALNEDSVADIIFWEKDGREYGQSHIYVDWDNDGMADLVYVLLFTR